MATRSSHGTAAVVIIGAGISGMCTAIDLIRHNKSRDFVIIEKGSQVGGTWNDNKYPGCCCDIWSHLYSFSGDPNPSWTREYPGQEEILAYLVSIAEKWGLYRHIRFNTAVQGCVWDEEDKTWKTTVRIEGGKAAEYGSEYTISSSFLVSGVGQLNQPQYPDIEGLDSFQGTIMHSARWDWSKSFAGKRVAIIGNGATAAQIIPEVAKVCEKLTVFQRTPNWVAPRGDGAISPTMQAIYRNIPLVRKRYRASLMDFRESFYDLVYDPNSAGNQILKDDHMEALQKSIPDDEELRAKLTPIYPPGCKRVIISDDFLPAMGKSNVSLETRKILRITPTGVDVDGEHHDANYLILATGFRTLEFMYPISIKGAQGRSIEDIWKGGARAYLGISVESLPNFAMLYGPNTNLGHNSIILMIEAQSRYIAHLISPILTARCSTLTLTITPKPTTIKAYNEEIQSRLSTSTFASNLTTSWYKDSNTGLISNNWCGTVVEYQEKTSQLHWEDYDLSGSSELAVILGEEKKVERWGRVVEETQVSTNSLIGAAAGVALLASLTAVGRSRFGKEVLARGLSLVR